MKRIGNLWNFFISDENINSAIRKSIKGKRKNPDIMSIATNPNIIENTRDLVSNPEKLPPHNYRLRIVYEGKKRNIHVISYYPWRIIHHMVINIIEPIFEKGFIEHTYGCIRGRGQHKGSIHCQKLVNKYEYALKCDIKKFYPSIKQDILYKLIKRKIKDKKLLKIIEIIVFSHKKGCPIGNLPSQLFGNIYLSQLDFYIKHTKGIKNYIRYVDDFLFCSNDKEELRQIKSILPTFLKENLGLRLSKNEIFKTKQGIDFLGYRHFKHFRLLRKSTKIRMKRNSNKLEIKYVKGRKTLEQCISSLSSYKGWIKQCNSYRLSKVLKLEDIRRKLTRMEFESKGTAFISGIKTPLRKVPMNATINALGFEKKKYNGQLKDIVKIQYFINEDETYYCITTNEQVIDRLRRNKFMYKFADLNIGTCLPLQGVKESVKNLIDKELIICDFRFMKTQQENEETKQKELVDTTQIQFRYIDETVNRITFTRGTTIREQLSKVNRQNLPFTATICKQDKSLYLK